MRRLSIASLGVAATLACHADRAVAPPPTMESGAGTWRGSMAAHGFGFFSVPLSLTLTLRDAGRDTDGNQLLRGTGELLRGDARYALQTDSTGGEYVTPALYDGKHGELAARLLGAPTELYLVCLIDPADPRTAVCAANYEGELHR